MRPAGGQSRSSRPGRPGSPVPPTDDALATFVVAQSQAAVVALHAQTVAVLNIKALISVVLDNISPNYTRWKTLLNNTDKYELSDHVVEDVRPEVVVDPHWRCMDCTVRSWLYVSVAPDLIEIASTAQHTACSIWLGLED